MSGNICLGNGMGGGKSWHQDEATAILLKKSTVQFKDGDIFDIPKQPTKRVCWTLEKADFVEPDRLEALAKKVTLQQAREHRIAK